MTFSAFLKPRLLTGLGLLIFGFLGIIPVVAQTPAPPAPSIPKTPIAAVPTLAPATGIPTPSPVASNQATATPVPSAEKKTTSDSSKTAPPPIPAETSPALVAADPNLLSLEALEHPWGTFLPETFARIRMTTTTFKDDQLLRNTSETLTVLESVGPASVKLKYMRAIELGSKRFNANPQVCEFDFYQQQVVPGQTIKNLKNAVYQIGPHRISCSVRQYELVTADWKQVTTVWYSKSVYPFVLRTETIKSALPTTTEPQEKVLSSTVVSVVETSAFSPPRWNKEGTYTLRSVRKSGDTTTTASISCSRSIPGGMASSISTETDAAGKVLSQTVASIVQYEALPAVIEYEPLRAPIRRGRYRWAPPVIEPDWKVIEER